jgi:uncharacterized protein YxjI
MVFRRRREGGAEVATRYTMRERLLDIGDDFWIEDGDGDKVFKVDGKALRLRNTLNLEDAQGNVVAQIQERMLRVRDSMAIERDGGTIATVHKDLVNIIRTGFRVNLADGGPDLRVQGNILEHEYQIEQDGRKVAEVSRKWVRVRDTYSVEVEPGQDDALILAIAICVDQLVRGGE